MHKRIIPFIFLFALILSACNFPGATGDSGERDRNAVLTAAAETVAVALTQGVSSDAVGTPASQSPTDVADPAATAAPVLTNTPLPSNTPLPTATSLPCNMATFVKDVTIPDDTVFAPGATFTKTWRLKNVGTCPWTSGYALVFDHGDNMGAAAAIQLTSGTVAPGQTLDVSVGLTAPAAAGTYRGDWRLRDSGGVVFGLTTGNSFWVQIKVVAPTATPVVVLPPAITVVTLNSIAAESASVREGGTVHAELPNVGDTSTPEGSQAFVSFDISGIPVGATVTEVKVAFSAYDTLGDPFGALGCLRMYAQSYQPINAGDYTAPGATNALVRWCNTGELDTVSVENDLKNQLQSELGGTRLQLRLQFKDMHHNGDGNADMVRFNKSNIKLIVTYTTP